MAFGQKQIAVAIPQPGTSNSPIPQRVRVSGGFLGLFPKFTTLPPFVPVKFSVIDQNAAAVAALDLQVKALLTSLSLQLGQANVPGTVIATLAEINSNLTRIADQKAAIASSLQNLSAAVGSYTSAMNQQTQILGTKAASQIQFNNFYKTYTNETPKMPSFKEQLEQSVKDGIDLNNQANKTGFLNTTINNTITATGSWITGTEVYQTISEYTKKIKDSILAVVPPSLKSITSQASTGKVPK